MNVEGARNKLSMGAFALGICYGSLYLGYTIVQSPDLGLAVIAGLVPVLISAWLIARGGTDTRFLLRLLAGAVIVRWVVAYFIFSKGLQNFFGGDAVSYDFFGNALCDVWRGIERYAPWLLSQIDIRRSGWGMPYYVGSIYYVIGRNPFAIQLINAGLGAATCVVVYKIAQSVYPAQRVARVAAILTAVSPSMILWSAQGLKDAPIAFCLCLCIYLALKLRERFQIKLIVFLSLFLICLYSLRHYAAYIVFLATAGMFVFAAKKFTPAKILQGGVLVIVLGIALSYFGAGDVAPKESDLKRMQEARVWSAGASNSGFGADVDITDPTAALGFLPLGILYVLFAPFPWMINNTRQLITLPELIVWWAFIPLLLRGYWFSIKHRLRETFGICVFTIGLTLAYALFQSNVGTAYRHRAQLFGFFFIFISIGLDQRRAARAKRRARFDFDRREFARPAAAVPVPLTSKPITQRSS